MTDRLRIALIGAGVFTRRAHVPALLTLPNLFEIVAVYSRTRESAEGVTALLPKPAEIYQDIDALLERDDIDAVDIILPIPAQAEIVEKALQAGKHIVSEKPIAPTVYEGQRLIDVYQKHRDQVWMVAENYRYSPSAQHAAHLIQDGAIGRPILADWTIHVKMTPQNVYYNTPWRRDNSFPGGFLLDGGVHHVAMLRMLLGHVEEVTAQAAQFREDLPPLDTLTSTLRFAGSALCNYAVTFVNSTGLRNPITILGEKGMLRVGFQEVDLVTEDGEEKFKFGDTDLVAAELEAFARAVKDNAPHLNTPEEALYDVQVIEALLHASETQRYVRLPQ